MCELFGISSRDKVQVNDLLKEFYSHSVRHPNGWGLAVFYNGSASLEKEPVPAYKSAYLRERLRHALKVRNAIGHIRLATVGTMEFENSHPFVQRDRSGRTWTLAHNGTIFDSPALNEYIYTQEGSTDSERILCHIVRRVNDRQAELGRALDAGERFALLDQVVCELAPHNKINLLLYDGELMYVHTNYKDTLYVQQRPDTALFATVPLGRGEWKPLVFTTLCAYRDGREVYRGTDHGCEYKDNQKDMEFLFADFAAL